jgi:prevent-host-death family protein
MAGTVQIGVRELKNRTTEILRRVEAGERVAVTRRGHVVALIEPASDAAGRASDSIYQHLRRHLAARTPGLRSGSPLREFARVSRKIARSLPYRSWREMERAAKGDRYGLSG